MDFPSSPAVGPSKRAFDDELLQSPTAKRAKRGRPNKKDREKSKGSIDQDDLASPDSISGTGIAQKETPVHPPIPFSLQETPKIRGSKSAKKSENSELKKKAGKKKDLRKELKDELEDLRRSESKNNEVEKNETEASAKKGAENGVKRSAAIDAPQTQANARKTRAEPNSEPKRPFNNGSSELPAVAGPSKITIKKKKPAYETRELTPLSDLAPIPDYTFKAYPNPVSGLGHGHGVGDGGGGNGGGGDGEGGGGVSGVGGTPRAGSAAAAREIREKLSKSMLQSRKTLEQCLAIYTEDMDRAETREEVVKYGGLAVQYAGDLFKTLG
ncbi:hypothetical protein F5144DRAFT_595869 [Chaetomium tenue]|uniref:Uncharacterized protein n=1 Tax=Chaetomium tenue TaxID=1854479 RepID=A0ACB7NZQ1_9PEZI|nr:hypothetical protein F5144DRAFT_595869 [Chaetomium globosum]